MSYEQWLWFSKIYLGMGLKGQGKAQKVTEEWGIMPNLGNYTIFQYGSVDSILKVETQ